jgi:hypothetical protein
LLWLVWVLLLQRLPLLLQLLVLMQMLHTVKNNKMQAPKHLNSNMKCDNMNKIRPFTIYNNSNSLKCSLKWLDKTDNLEECHL